jgi:hypothetical protein
VKTGFIICTLVMLSALPVYSATFTFDEFPSGTVLRYTYYRTDCRVLFYEEFRATDHTGSDWGLPHSGNNVATVNANPYFPATISFGYFTGGNAHWDPVQSVRAFFSTKPGASIRINAYQSQPYRLRATLVLPESLENELIEISTFPDQPFDTLDIEGVNSWNDLGGFCLDDMTITLVPEPSSLLALGAGLMGLGAVGLLRRRVNGKR